MLITVAMLLVALGVADIISGIFTTRFIERLSAELFEAVEKQRQTFRQLRLVRAELKSAETRREMAQHTCDELREKLSRILVRLNALAEHANQRKKVKVRGQRPD